MHELERRARRVLDRVRRMQPVQGVDEDRHREPRVDLAAAPLDLR
jgi:hypothetical protein